MQELKGSDNIFGCKVGGPARCHETELRKAYKQRQVEDKVNSQLPSDIG